MKMVGSPEEEGPRSGSGLGAAGLDPCAADAKPAAYHQLPRDEVTGPSNAGRALLFPSPLSPGEGCPAEPWVPGPGSRAGSAALHTLLQEHAQLPAFREFS